MKKLICLFCVLMMLCTVLVGCGSTAANNDVDTDEEVTTTTTSEELTEADAKFYALHCAGVTEDRVSNYKVNFTYNKEKECDVYEVSFDVGRVHYDFIFRAKDFDIIKFDKIIGENKE